MSLIRSSPFISSYQTHEYLSSNDCRFKMALNASRVNLRQGLKRSDPGSGEGGTGRSNLQSRPEVFLEIHNDMG